LSVAKGSEGAKFQAKSLSSVVTVATPLVLVKPGDLDPATRAQIEENARDIIEANPEVGDALQLSDGALATKISKEARSLRNSIEEELNGWCLLSESDPRRGEAAAQADAALIKEKAFGDPTTNASYILQDVFVYGGKEPCTPVQEKSTIGQGWARIVSTFEIKHPKLLSAVTVKKANDTTVPAGETPPAPSVVEGATPVTVVLLRNLGNLRFIPFAFALVNGLLFAVFVIVLHSRDKLAMANKAAFAASKA